MQIYYKMGSLEYIALGKTNYRPNTTFYTSNNKELSKTVANLHCRKPYASSKQIRTSGLNTTL